MTNSRYNTRANYERLYGWLLKARQRTTNINNLSDYHLLCAINKELMRFDLIPFDSEELEMELH